MVGLELRMLERLLPSPFRGKEEGLGEKNVSMRCVSFLGNYRPMPASGRRPVRGDLIEMVLKVIFDLSVAHDLVRRLQLLSELEQVSIPALQ